MTTYTTAHIHTSTARAPRRISLLQWIMSLFELRRQRRALADLDPQLLEDIGLSREAAAEEAHRKFWDAPDHWLR